MHDVYLHLNLQHLIKRMFLKLSLSEKFNKYFLTDKVYYTSVKNNLYHIKDEPYCHRNIPPTSEFALIKLTMHVLLLH